MGKGGGGGHTPVIQPDSLKSQQKLTILDLLCEGEIEGIEGGAQGIYLNDTPIMNDDGSYNFTNTSYGWREGTASYKNLSSIPATQSEVVVSTEITYDTPVSRTITNDELDKIRLTFGVSALVQSHTNGDRTGSSVSLKIELYDGSSWKEFSTETIEGKTSSQYLKSVTIEGLPQTPFTIRISRLTVDSDSDLLQNQTLWSSYTEIIDDKLIYPYTAMAALELDSEQFNGVPTRNYLVLGRKVKVPSNYDPDTREYEGLWDGTFEMAWTNNPAWIFYDLATESRAGLGRRLGEDGCDKWAMYQIAQYCDELVSDGSGGYEPRMTCNIYLSEPDEARTVFDNLASVFRGMAVWDGQQLSASMDTPSDPVYHYTNANVVDGKFSYQGSAQKARHTVAHVTWVDPDDGWEDAVEYVDDEDLIKRYGINVTQVRAWGCTSKAQAIRTGKWILTTEKLERQAVSFEVGREGLRHLPGDVIEVADNHYAGAKIGGRVLSVDGNVITLDREVDITDGQTYQLAYMNGNSKTARLNVLESLSGDVLRLDGIPEGIETLGIWTLTGSTLSTRLFRCTSISETETGYSISALEHIPEKHQIIEEGIEFEKSTDTYYSRVPQILRLQADMEPDSSTVRVYWDVSVSTMNVDIELQLLRNGKLLRSDTVNDTELVYDALAVGEYTVSARAVNEAGQKGGETQAVFTISLPTTPAGIEFTEDNTIIAARPDVETQPLGTEYDWYWGETYEQAVELSQYLGRAFTMTHNALSPDTQYWYAVQAVNALGRSDVVVRSTKTTLNPDDILTVIQDQITHEHLNDELNSFLSQVDSRSLNTESLLAETQIDVGDLSQSLDNLNSDVEQSLSDVSLHLNNVQQLQSSLSQSVFGLASDMRSATQEYERRLLAGETLIGAVATIDSDTGQIVNHAFSYADERFSEAGQVIDGVKASVTTTANEVQRVESETGARIEQAEAELVVQAGKISQKASYNEVSEIVAGAIDAITPAKSWQFNTSVDGWSGGTWVIGGHITGSQFSVTGLEINADENPVVRLRVKGVTSGSLSWNGGSQAITLKAPASADEFETLILTLTEADGWTGTIESLQVSMDASIDFIEIGKPSAAEQALEDISARTTVIEQEIDPEHSRWSVYATQEWVNSISLTLTDVQQTIDAAEAEWGVTATFQKLTDSDTINKANTAQSWVTAAEANIESSVVAFNAKPGGVDEKLSEQSSQLSTAQQSIDALNGTVEQTVTSLSDVEGALGVDLDAGFDTLMGVYQDFLAEKDFQQQKVAFSYAQEQIESHSNDLDSQAQYTLELFAAKDSQQAQIQQLQTASVNNEQAIAQTKSELQTEFTNADESVLSAANEHTNTAISSVEQSVAQTKSELQTQLTNADQSVLSAANEHTNTAISSVEQSVAQTKSELQTQLTNADQSVLNAANEHTNTAISSVEQSVAQTKSELQTQLTNADQSVLNAANEHTDTAISSVEQSVAQTKSDLQTQLTNADESVLSAANTRTDEAFSNAEQSLSQTTENLQASITEGDSQTLSEAKSFTRGAVGYCVDANGNITDEKNAVACVADGNTWTEGPLAEYIRQVMVKNASGATASVTQLMQTFENIDGQLVARGGLLTNNNGRVSGMVNTNDGSASQLDFIADHHRWGAEDKNENFVPLLYLHPETKKAVLNGRLILDDGHEVTRLDDIRGTDGQHGAGSYTLTLRDGAFPSDSLATGDFVYAYGRNPVLDDHLTYRNADGTASSTRRFNGSSWVAPTMLIHGDLLATGTISGDRLRANTISGDRLLANAISADKIATEAIQARHLSAGSVTAEHLTADAITTEHLEAVTINASQITGSKILVDSGTVVNVYSNGEKTVIETDVEVSNWNTSRTFVATAGAGSASSSSGTGMWWGFEATVRHATPWNPTTGTARIQIVATAFMYGNSNMTINNCNWKLWELI